MLQDDPSDFLRLAHEAFGRDDAPAVRRLLEKYPALKARINDPVGPFNSPAIMSVRSRDMLDALLDAGADINARSQWWAGGFGLLDCASPEVAAYAIERGAIITAHAAARLGMLDKLSALVAAATAKRRSTSPPPWGLRNICSTMAPRSTSAISITSPPLRNTWWGSVPKSHDIWSAAAAGPIS